jgi:hypothetical protein
MLFCNEPFATRGFNDLNIFSRESWRIVGVASGVTGKRIVGAPKPDGSGGTTEDESWTNISPSGTETWSNISPSGDESWVDINSQII